jgi:hypothetical protein
MKKTVLIALCAAFIAAYFSGCVVINFSEFDRILRNEDKKNYEYNYEFGKTR